MPQQPAALKMRERFTWLLIGAQATTNSRGCESGVGGLWRWCSKEVTQVILGVGAQSVSELNYFSPRPGTPGRGAGGEGRCPTVRPPLTPALSPEYRGEGANHRRILAEKSASRSYFTIRSLAQERFFSSGNGSR